MRGVVLSQLARESRIEPIVEHIDKLRLLEYRIVRDVYVQNHEISEAFVALIDGSSHGSRLKPPESLFLVADRKIRYDRVPSPSLCLVVDRLFDLFEDAFGILLAMGPPEAVCPLG